MPELAEVDYFRRRWEPFHGKKILSASLHPKARVFRDSPLPPLSENLAGQTLRASRCHGKQMFLRFSGGTWVRVHLGMTGELKVEPRDHPPGPHDHWVLRLKSASLVFRDPRMFGRVMALPGAEDPTTALPPAVNDPLFTVERVAKLLQKRSGAPIKAVLLDQDAFPGVGNWMADEILWRCRWHPATPVRELPANGAKRLWKETVAVATTAMEIIAPSWGDLPDTWLMNHRWEAGHTCPRPACHSPLDRATIAGRTTCWCPKCQ